VAVTASELGMPLAVKAVTPKRRALVMTRGLTRRRFAESAATFGALSLGLPAFAQGAATKVLKYIPQNDLRVLDPIWTTAYSTRNHGYMVFDTLFALDANMKAQPQMVGAYDITPDGLHYSFMLRDGLKFHDGEAVRATDCVASIKRWMARDVLGQSLAAVMDEIASQTDNGFAIRLKTPFPLLIDGLAKVSTLLPVIMPERLAQTDPYTQVTEMIGSGPFKFVKEEFEPGHQVVYARNTDYVSRSEAPSWASGGKVVKVDRVEWVYIPDNATAAAALSAGEVDWWESPPADYFPTLSGDKNIRLVNTNKLGQMTMLRFNQLHPPFDNLKIRQAVLAVTDQKVFMSSISGDAENWSVCASFFTCGGPMASDIGSDALTSPRDVDKAKKLVSEAGYKGEKIVLLHATDTLSSNGPGLIAADIMQKLGLNVDVVTMDFGSLVTRRASKDPPEKGGWSVFATGWVGVDQIDPATNQGLRANGEKGWFGWPTDSKLEELRAQWLTAPTLEARRAIAADIQRRAFEVVPYVPLGKYVTNTAVRTNITWLIEAPPILMWNIEKG
jgi:peptide/nickel transport system substrate-binding protein